MYYRSLPPRFVDATMESLQPCFDKVKEYARHLPQRIRGGQGIFLSGPSGVGKTYAIAAMTRAAAKGIQYELKNEKRLMTLREWLFVTGPDLFESYSLPYEAGDKDKTALIEKVPWLVINDLGKENRTGKFAQLVNHQLGKLIRYRNESKKVTHFTTNLLLEPDEENPGMSIQEIYGESILSLLYECCPFRYQITGPDWRKRK